MRSPIITKILEEMDKDPWHVKTKRKINAQIWVYMSYRQHYGFSEAVTIMTRHWFEKYQIGYKIKYITAQILLFVPALAVLIHQAGMIIINCGLVVALIYLGKYLLKPILKRFKAPKL